MQVCCCALVTCSCSNIFFVKLAVRVGETRPNPQILILIVESCKLVISFSLFYVSFISRKDGKAGIIIEESARGGLGNGAVGHKTNLRFFMLFSVPGICYTVCNTLPYIILESMDVITYVMAAVLKVPLTAFMMRIILKTKLSSGQWLALVLLSSGSLLSMLDFKRGIQLRGSERGYHLTLLSIFLSAFAAVWTEFLLKKTQQSIHVQNMQLYFHGILANIFALFILRGYNYSFGRLPTLSDTAALLSVVTTVGMGLLTSVVMKHADNIIRLFLSGASLSLAQILASSLFNEALSFQHVAGLVLTLVAFYLYDYLGYQSK